MLNLLPHTEVKLLGTLTGGGMLSREDGTWSSSLIHKSKFAPEMQIFLLISPIKKFKNNLSLQNY